MDSEVTWNKKNLGKWIKALRSKRYKQVDGALYRGTAGYCCLGVAAKISRVGKFDNHGIFYDNRKTDDRDEGIYCSSTSLTDGVKNWLGADQWDPPIEFPEEYCWKKLHEAGEDTRYALQHRVTATIMNDDWDLTFPQIADMLEYFIYNNLSDEPAKA